MSAPVTPDVEPPSSDLTGPKTQPGQIQPQSGSFRQITLGLMEAFHTVVLSDERKSVTNPLFFFRKKGGRIDDIQTDVLRPGPENNRSPIPLFSDKAGQESRSIPELIIEKRHPRADVLKLLKSNLFHIGFDAIEGEFLQREKEWLDGEGVGVE